MSRRKMQSEPGQQPSRAAAVIALLLSALLVSGLVLDVINFRERYIFIVPSFGGDDSVAVADTITRNRMLSYFVGMAAREAAGARLVREFYVPVDLDALTTAKQDVFQGTPQPSLSRRLIQPVVRGRMKVRAYDTTLPESAIARFSQEGRLIEFPRGVYAVKPAENGSGRVVLFSDEAKKRLFVVPEELAPL